MDPGAGDVVATALDALAPGDRLGTLVIERALGRGGMGVVYQARDAGTGEVVAVKVPTRAVAIDPDLRARFEREGRALASVDHPCVVRVKGQLAAAGWPYLVLELVAGGSLRGLLRERGALPWREACDLTLGVARALAVTHAAGLVHRDLKPDNVLLDAGRPKLSDFGLVREARPSASDLTRTGELLGTPAYMAPEQADSARAVGPPADLYALGCILHELLTGRPPFPGSGFDVISKHLGAPPSRPRLVAPDVPESIDGLVVALLAKEPATRPGALDVMAVLEVALRAPGRPARSARGPCASGAAVVAVVALGIALALRRPAPPDVGVSPSAPPPLATTAAPSPAATAAPSPVTTAAPRAGPLRLERQDEISPDPRLRHELPVWAIAAWADGLITADEGGGVRRWDVRTGARRWLAPAPAPSARPKVVALALVDGGARVLSISGDGSIEALDAATGARGPRVGVGGDDALVSAGAPSDGRFVVVATEGGTVACIALPDGHALPLGQLGARPSVAVDGAGRRVVAGDREHLVVWDLIDIDAPVRRDLAAGRNGVTTVAQSQDGRILAAGRRAERTVSVWHLDDPLEREGLLLGSLADDVATLAVSPDGRFVAAGGIHGCVRVWDLERDAAFDAPGHDGDVCALAFAGGLLFSDGASGVLRAWDAMAPASRPPLDRLPSSCIEALALDPSHDRVAIGRADGLAEVRDVAALSSVTVMSVSSVDPVLAVALRDETLLAGTRRIAAALDLTGAPPTLLWDRRSIAVGFGFGRPAAAGDGFLGRDLFSSNPLLTDRLDAAAWPASGDSLAALQRRAQGAPGRAWLCRKGSPPMAFDPGAADVFCLALAESGKILATAGESTTSLWDARTGALLASYRAGATWVALSPSGQAALWWDTRLQLQAVDASGQASLPWPAGDRPTAAVFTREDEALVGTHAGGLVRIHLAR